MRLPSIAVLVLCVSLGGPASAEQPFPFDASAPLQIVINDQVFPRSGSEWTGPSFEYNRFTTLTGVIERSLRMAGVVGALTFERWSPDVPEADQRLMITLQHWEISPVSFDSSVVIECRIGAVLRASGQKLDMGVFRGQDTRVRMQEQLFEDDYRPAAEEAVLNMIEFYSAAVRGVNLMTNSP